MKDYIFVQLEQSQAAYKKAKKNFDENVKYSNDYLEKITVRMNQERQQDHKRQQELEKSLAGSPRVELQRINERLAAVPKTENDYWRRYYHSATGTIKSEERQQLEKRKIELEKNITLLPITAEENELAELRLKSYKPTQKERQKLAECKKNLEQAHATLLNETALFKEKAVEARERLNSILETDSSREKSQRESIYMEIYNKIHSQIGA